MTILLPVVRAGGPFPALLLLPRQVGRVQRGLGARAGRSRDGLLTQCSTCGNHQVTVPERVEGQAS